MLLATLSVVFLCSIIRQNALTSNPCIPWLFVIYPLSVGEIQDLTGHPYVRWLCLVFIFSLKILKGLLRSLWWFFLFEGISLLCNELSYFFSGLWHLPPLWECGLPFGFFKCLLLYLWFFFLDETLLALVLGAIGFPFWINYDRIIYVHGVKDLCWWSELLVLTELPSLSIEPGNPLKLSINKLSSSCHSLEVKLFFIWTKSGIIFHQTSNFYFKLSVIPI